jgi:hypothetical protein
MRFWRPKVAGHVPGLFERVILRRAPAKPSTDLLIVPRGFAPDFYFFCEVFAEQRRAKVLTDRRVNDRRHLPRDVSADRRGEHDRRGPTPATWKAGNFVLARSPLEPAGN